MKQRTILLYVSNSTEQSPSWEANSHSASQEIIRILRKPLVHYCVLKSPPLVPNLSQMNPVHTFPPCFPKFHSTACKTVHISIVTMLSRMKCRENWKHLRAHSSGSFHQKTHCLSFWNLHGFYHSTNVLIQSDEVPCISYQVSYILAGKEAKDKWRRKCDRIGT
jgi:hypothetical protein